MFGGWDSVMSIASRYGLNGPESNPGGNKIIRAVQTDPKVPLNVLYNGYQVFFRGQSGWNMVMTTHRLLESVCEWVRAVPPPCYGVTLTF
jgi:hypothetical protein